MTTNTIATKTGLLDVTAYRLTGLSPDAFRLLATAATAYDCFELLKVHFAIYKIDVGGAFIRGETYLRESELDTNVLFCVYTKNSLNGLVLIRGKGIWSLSGGSYSWSEFLRFKLRVQVTDQNVLLLGSGK